MESELQCQKNSNHNNFVVRRLRNWLLTEGWAREWLRCDWLVKQITKNFLLIQCALSSLNENVLH